jgi:TPR repeat protein
MKSTVLIALATSLLVGCASHPQSTQAPRLDFAHLSPERGVRFDTPTSHLFEGDDRFRQQQSRALAGDTEAMVTVAQMYARGTNGVARDEKLMVQWLVRASELNYAAASYRLYLHYLARGLDRNAVRYENLAVRQGYVIPPRLDPRRG